LAAAVARSYLVVNFNQERINVSKSALDDANRLLATYKEKKRYGLIEDSDLKQAEVTVELHETDLSLAKSDFERMKLELFEYLQRNNQIPSETSFATTLSTSAISTPQDLTEALRLGFNNRNDLKSLKWEMESAEWAYRSERLDTLPDLGLT
jgi:outer membrane protein TolC